MELKDFFEKRPYLYHLTYKENIEKIKRDGVLYSTLELIKNSNDESSKKYLNEKRVERITISLNGIQVIIRDQRPISLVALGKCLNNGWDFRDYLYFLNQRVFMWCTIERLQRHFDRYCKENPVIIRLKTPELIELNPHVRFSNINSGATRANSYLGGIAPKRGIDTFKIPSKYGLPISSIAEVTFESKCILPEQFEIGKKPTGRWEQIK